VCDASSDLLSRPIPVERYGLLYAGAQKNAGPAGLTIVVLREDLLERIPRGVPTMLDYRTYVEHRSLYNTPPVFAIYVLMLVTRWLRDEIEGSRPWPSATSRRPRCCTTRSTARTASTAVTPPRPAARG
jgi:phosphoserine aminotransferase